MLELLVGLVMAIAAVGVSVAVAKSLVNTARNQVQTYIGQQMNLFQQSQRADELTSQALSRRIRTQMRRLDQLNLQIQKIAQVLAQLENGSAVYSNITLTSLSPNALVATQSDKSMQSVTIVNSNGNQVSFSGSSLLASLTQDLQASATPTFDNLRLSSLSAIASILAVDNTGEFNAVTIDTKYGFEADYDPATATLTLATPQDLSPDATPEFISIQLSNLVSASLLASNDAKGFTSVALAPLNTFIATFDGATLTLGTSQGVAITDTPLFANLQIDSLKSTIVTGALVGSSADSGQLQAVSIVGNDGVTATYDGASSVLSIGFGGATTPTFNNVQLTDLAPSPLSIVATTATSSPTQSLQALQFVTSNGVDASVTEDGSFNLGLSTSALPTLRNVALSNLSATPALLSSDANQQLQSIELKSINMFSAELDLSGSVLTLGMPTEATPQFTNVALSGMSPGRLVASSTDTVPVLQPIALSPINNFQANYDSKSAALVLGTSQDVSATGSPTFNIVTLNGLGGVPTLLSSDYNNKLQPVTLSTASGMILALGDDGGFSIDTPQELTDQSTPQFGGLTINQAIQTDITMKIEGDPSLLSRIQFNTEDGLALTLSDGTSLQLQPGGTVATNRVIVDDGKGMMTATGLTLSSLTPTRPVKSGPSPSGQSLVTAAINLASDNDVTGILSTAHGGTGQALTLGSNRVLISSAGSIAESGELTTGQVLMGITASAPVPSTIVGTSTNQVLVSVNTTLSQLQLALPQDIGLTSLPTFSAVILTSLTANRPLRTASATKQLISGAINLAATNLDVTNILPLVSGGTGSAISPLLGGRLLMSSTSLSSMIEAASLAIGQFMAGTGNATTPLLPFSLVGTANQVIVSAANTTLGQLVLSLPQSIGTSSAVQFSSLTLSTLTVASSISALSNLVVSGTFSAPTATLTSLTIATSLSLLGPLTSSSTITLTSLTASMPVKTSAAKALVSALIDLTADVTGTLPVVRGGTGLTTPFSGFRTLWTTSTTALAESPALTNGQFFLGATGQVPVIGTLAGTASQVIVTPSIGATTGTLTLSLPQSIATSSSPTFSGLTLTSLSVGTISSNVILSSLTASLPLKLNATKQIVSAAINLASGSTEVTGTLPVASGGTGTASIVGGRIMISFGTTSIVEAPALATGQFLIASAASPFFAAGSVTGTATQIAVVSNGSGYIISLPSTTIFPGPVSVPFAFYAQSVNVTTLTANMPIKTNGTSQLTSAAINLALSSPDITGTLAVTNGGTGSSTAMNAVGRRLMVSTPSGSGPGTIVEGPQLMNGQVAMGNAAGTLVVAATITPTADTTVVIGTSTITIGTVQSISTAATPIFASLSLTATAPLSLPGLTASRPMKTGPTGIVTATQITLSSTNDVTGVLAVANGGTGNATALTNGQLLIGSTGSPTALVPGNITAAANTVTVTNGAGTITLGLASTVQVNNLIITTLGASLPVRSSAALGVITGAINLASSTDVTNVLPLSSGGTGATPTTFAQVAGQLLIGTSSTTSPVAATITPVTNQTTVTAGSGTITIGTVQDIGSGSTPVFTGAELTGTGLLLPTVGGIARNLNYYEEYTHVTSWNGAYGTTSVPGNVLFVRVGSLVTAMFPAVIGTCTATNPLWMITVAPTRFRPGVILDPINMQIVAGVAQTATGTTNTEGIISIGTGGNFQFWNGVNQTFTIGNQVGIFAPFSVSYVVNLTF